MKIKCISSQEVYLDGKKLDIEPSLKYRNHSPSGFMWGYGGSGPAQLALAIMLKTLKGSSSEYRIPDYQKFKFDVIAKLPQKPCVATVDFWAWLLKEKNFKLEIKELENVESSEFEEQEPVPCTKGHEADCANALSKECNCDCGGRNHGIAHKSL